MSLFIFLISLTSLKQVSTDVFCFIATSLDRWIKGPSAIGSENGKPISVKSTLASRIWLNISFEYFSDG